MQNIRRESCQPALHIPLQGIYGGNHHYNGKDAGAYPYKGEHRSESVREKVRIGCRGYVAQDYAAPSALLEKMYLNHNII